MADRLAVMREPPSRILDWQALAGQSGPALAHALPMAAWTPVEGSPQALRRVPPWPGAPRGGHGSPSAEPGQDGQAPRDTWLNRWRRRLWPGAPALDAAPATSAAHTARDPATRQAPFCLLPAQVPPGQASLLWCNMGLHAQPDPHALLKAWHDALEVGGCLMFSTFGPDTLRELRTLYARQGWGPPSQAFVDMHDWGDALVRAGFADPVMDQEVVQLTWESPEAALAELRTLGRNAHPGRHPGLRGRAWRDSLLRCLSALAQPRIALSFEIVYGHAFKAPPRLAVAPVTDIPLETLRHMARQTPKPR